VFQGSVGLLACVPPETTMLRPDTTHACKNHAACEGNDPSATRSESRAALATNLRTKFWELWH
jgi:hypothetical protein